MTIENILKSIDSEIARLEAVRKLLAPSSNTAVKKSMSNEEAPVKKRKKLSAASRKRIAEAQKKRWAAVKKNA